MSETCARMAQAYSGRFKKAPHSILQGFFHVQSFQVMFEHIRFFSEHAPA
jgi:hypothetical protein